MKKTFFYTVLVLCLCLKTASAQTVYYPGHYPPAQEAYQNKTKVYLAVKGGMGQVNAVESMPDGGNGQDIVPTANLAVGTFFKDAFRAEVEYAGYYGASGEIKQMTADLGSGPESVRYKQDLQIHMVTANILVEYKSVPLLFRPYIGAGMGAAYIGRKDKYTALSSPNSASKKENEIHFAAVGKAGLLFPITEGIGLDVSAQAAYITTSDPIYIYTALAGIRISF